MGYRIQNAEYGIEYGIRNMEYRFRIPEYGIRNVDSVFWDMEYGIKNTEDGIRFYGYR